MPHRDEPGSAAIMAVYEQQRRFDRIRSARVIARAIAIAALLAFVVVVVWAGSTGPGTAAVRALIGAGLILWVLAFVCDIRVQSHRLQSRVTLAQQTSVQSRLDALETDLARDERETS